MLFTNGAIICCILIITAMVFYQIYTGFTAAHPNYEGTEIHVRRQGILYVIYASFTAAVLGLLEVGTVNVWGNYVIDYFELGTGEYDQTRWVVLGLIVAGTVTATVIIMYYIARLAEKCGYHNIILHPRYHKKS